MRILITGGAGCLGGNLIEHFYPAMHEFLVLDNFATGRREVVDGIPRVQVVDGSVYDHQLVDSVFDEFQPTHVIHSAAAYKDPRNWKEDAQTNVTGTIIVAEAAIRHKVKRFVNFQTALCYGRPESVPIPVTHVQRPFTSYGISKTAGEQYLLSLASEEMEVVSLRLANVTGPRLAIGPIPTFYQRLKEGKSCFCSETVRDFLDMSDFLALMDKVLVAGAPTGVFNVSTGQGNSIKDIFDAVVAYLGIQLDEPVKVVPPGDDDVPAVVLDPAETERAFGWKAQVGFEQTIHRMLSWYDHHGISAIYSHLASPTSDK
ncbi:NAD-dependent epimerase/dehydratase family protein [Mariprofundus erugo]|nr:NAD-dependent epimerase/dehydratase family protein [Mariprofundus erugo]